LLYLNEAYQTLVNDEKRSLYDEEFLNNKSEEKMKKRKINLSDIIWYKFFALKMLK